MGKLHRLKKDIKNNPEKYILYDFHRGVRGNAGARFANGKWHPVSWRRHEPYHAFVKKVLLQVGLTDIGSTRVDKEAG